MSKKENIVEIKNNEELNDIEVPEIQDIPGDDKKEEKDMKENTKKDEKKVFVLFRPFVAIGNVGKAAWGWAKKNPGKAIAITNTVTALTMYGVNAATQKRRNATRMPIETNFVDKSEVQVPSIEDIQVPEIPPIPEIPEIPTDIPVTE